MALEVLADAHDGVGYVGSLRRKGNVVWAVGGVWGVPLVMTSESGATFRRRKPPDMSGIRDVLPFSETHAIVVGEGGALSETKDGETWVPIETGTKGCLFALERAFGSIWLAGDAAFVMSSADGLTWRKPALGESVKELGRIQRLRVANGALWFLGYTGKLGVLKNDEVQIATLESNAPLTSIAFSSRGVGVVVGDRGTVFRSTDKGRTWARVEVDTEEDLEDIIWNEGSFVVPGAGGTLLVSDDGESFRAVDTGRDEHLWSVMRGAKGGVLVGGDGGLVLLATKADLCAPQPITQTTPKEALQTSEHVGRAVQQALYTDDGVLVRVESSVHRIRGWSGVIEPLSGVLAFGRSRDRKHFAVANDADIEIRPALDRAAHTVLPIPKSLGAIRAINVFPSGDRVLVTTGSGAWLVSARGTECIHAGKDVHAALSSDGRVIACGDESSAHRLFVIEGGRFVLGAEIEAVSPCHALFHDTKPHVCLSAQSGSIALDLDVLKQKKKNPLKLSGLDVLSDKQSICCGVSRADGYTLGDRDGDVWSVGFEGQPLGHIDVGAIASMDSSADGKSLLIGSCGLLVERESSDDGREIRRWVF